MLHTTGYLTAYILIVAGILGAIMGSFLNCLAWRIGHGESIMKGRSHCPACNHSLGILDLFPVLSYIFLRGKCRYCGGKLSPRYLVSELMMALGFVLTAVYFGIRLETVFYLVLVCLLMGLSLVDLETYTIPNGFITGAIINFLLLMFIPYGVEQGFSGLVRLGFDGAVLALAMLTISLIFDKVTGKESLGGGDIKLFFVAGLYLGLFKGILCIILSCVIGIGFSFFMKQKRIPFGPAISLAIFVCLLVGDGIVSWYIGLLNL